MKLKLGFLASHNGTDMQAIIDAIETKKLNAVAKIVISNNSTAKALQYAKTHNIPAIHISSQTTLDEDASIKKALKEHKVNVVILAGYMKKIGPKTLKEFENRIINVHPALLPKYAGLYGDAVHEAVLKNKEQITGATIHLVDNQYDHGKILAQKSIRIGEKDTLNSLKRRIQTLEKALFLKVLQDLALNNLTLDNI